MVLRNYTEISESIYRIPKLYRDSKNYTGISKNYTQLSQLQTYEITQTSEIAVTSAATNGPKNPHKKIIQKPSTEYTDLQNYKKPSTAPQNLYEYAQKHLKLHRDLRIYTETSENTQRLLQLSWDLQNYTETTKFMQTHSKLRRHIVKVFIYQLMHNRVALKEY